MDKAYLLEGSAARGLYEHVRELPILDYHCHLSPAEIYEDRPFSNIGQMWLGGDHYKWRLMRACGIRENRITGSADWKDKFLAYAEAIATAAGNPLYHWTAMELSLYFGVEKPLSPDTAEEIWEKANAVIAEKRLSPRKLIEQSRVRYIATTDDVNDSLEYHALLAADKSFGTTVAPSFRTDRLLGLREKGYADYIRTLSHVSGVTVTDLASLKEAVKRRLDVFQAAGCRFTDVGIPEFPDRVAKDEDASKTFVKAITSVSIEKSEHLGFLGNMFRFLGCEYTRRGLVMQWHMASLRNVNSHIFDLLGRDCGGDCVGDAVPGADIARMLDAIETAGGLPVTILYTLNGGMLPQMATIAGSFSRVLCGTAWWFCDHKRGITDTIETLAETGHLGVFPGMLTDSRSFLSYARHDYFRRILCSVIGGWIDKGEYPGGKYAEKLAEAICFGNVNTMIGGTISKL